MSSPLRGILRRPTPPRPEPEGQGPRLSEELRDAERRDREQGAAAAAANQVQEYPGSPTGLLPPNTRDDEGQPSTPLRGHKNCVQTLESWVLNR